MRGKRSKQYRKLMERYTMTFGFRPPFQVLVDSGMLKDAERFKMDLVAGLERTLHGKVKPLISQCSMRHLYKNSKEEGVPQLIERAKSFERRRCGHHPDDYPEPLDEISCLRSIVDGKGTGQNKHRYVIASQDLETRKAMRAIPGCPLIYIHRSVMILEPMAGVTAQNRDMEERKKIRDGIRRVAGPQGMKRKLDEDEATASGAPIGVDGAGQPAKQKKKGRKEPNPLSVKKAKKPSEGEDNSGKIKKIAIAEEAGGLDDIKRKRRRKHKTGGEDLDENREPGEAATDSP